MNKLKLDKNFQPIPSDEGDEMYPNGIFVFNITKLMAFIKANPNKFPLEEFEVKKLRTFPSCSLNESTIQTANLSTPIILAEISPGRFNVIDGNHRLEKAHRDGLNKILAYKVSAEQHVVFLTSEKAYKLYVKYWNSKIDDINGDL